MAPWPLTQFDGGSDEADVSLMSVMRPDSLEIVTVLSGSRIEPLNGRTFDIVVVVGDFD